MSRSFTLCVGCVGTTLEWDCGSTVATQVWPSVVKDLHNACKENEKAGYGGCGFASHKIEGMQAYYTVRQLALIMFAGGAVGKATLLHEFANVYADALLSACGEYQEHISYEMRDNIEAMLKASHGAQESQGAKVTHATSAEKALSDLLREHEWLLSVRLDASR